MLQFKLRRLLTFILGYFVTHTAIGHGQSAKNELWCERIFQELPRDYRVPLRRVRGGGFDRFQTDISILREHLINLVSEKAARNDRTIKIALGGTLAFETQLFSDLILEVTQLFPTGSDWKIEIAAYSINSEYLLRNASEVRKRKPKGIRFVFEILDLMDPVQVRHLTRRRPDVVLMLNSLYINSSFSFESIYRLHANESRLREIDSNYHYFFSLRDRIFDVLPAGGIFAIESIYRGQGLPPGRFELIPPRGKGVVESGIYIKPR